ncbi:MAG: hypothetical protein HYR60_11210 [Acidobacteria bacterium]|nr:hypothetical protein [Acidobacteriota bacterium]
MTLPEIHGRPILIQFQPDLRVHHGKLVTSGGSEVHAASCVRRREMVLDGTLRRRPRELRRIFMHELFHFAWPRLGNPKRRSYEELLESEIQRRVRGELGWSAQMRKKALGPDDPRIRTRHWREYVCESFCDTAAWLFAGLPRHVEFTLPDRARRRRRDWFEKQGLTRRIAV